MKLDGFLADLSPHLFWDCDVNDLDPERHANFIIARTMDRGNSRDVTAVWNRYGDERIREALVGAASLEKRTVAYFANQFDLSPEAFRAHRNRSDTWEQ